MKKQCIGITAFLLALPSFGMASPPGQGGNFGLGIILGDPTGLTGKVFFGENQAVDFHIGGEGIDDRSDLAAYVDFLFHMDTGVQNPYFQLPLYVGPGAAVFFDDRRRYCTRTRCYGDNDLWLAARVPFGVAFLFKKFNGEAFVELSGKLFLTPFRDIDIDLALGFRYYF